MTYEENLIKKFREIHGDRFKYPKFNTTTMNYKIDIICPEHGVFKKFIYQHLRRKEGCPKCSKLGAPRMTNQEFLKRLNNIYKGSIPFEVLSEYKGYNKPIRIRNKYGECELYAGVVLRGSSGTLNSALDRTKYMIEQFKEKHNNYYDYGKYEYKGNRGLSIITCPIHGDFKQMTDVHLMGHGCTECNCEENRIRGFGRRSFVEKSGNVASLYLIRAFDNKESFLKIGITTKDVNKRFSCKHDLPYGMEVIKIIKGDPGEIWDLEYNVKKALKDKTYSPKKYFKGSRRECFKEESLSSINEILNNNE